MKMSDYGIRKEEFDELAENARTMMGGLFMADPCERTHEACVKIYNDSFR